MMILTDTHSHLYDAAFDHDREQAVGRARKAGVATILLPGIDSESHERLFGLARAHPEICKPMMGLHPTAVNDNPRWREELALVESYLASPPAGIDRFWGVGETGIDLHWSAEFFSEQAEAFERQTELALHYELPVVVHSRDAWPKVLEILAKYRGRGLRGVMHAFSGGVEEYRRVKDLGDFVFGISGVVTYKKSSLVDVVRAMSLEDIVLETDCPYLTPEPHRGTRNESAYVAFVCERVAALRDMEPAAVAAATTTNARRVFGW